MQGGKLVALTYTALTINLTTDPAKAGVAQFLPFETATLKRITVLADTVTILERIDLNGIDLRIVARELRCAEGYAQCVINTSGRQNEASLKANSKQAQSGSRGNGFGGPGGKGADGRWIACQNPDVPGAAALFIPLPHFTQPCSNRPQAPTASAARMAAASTSQPGPPRPTWSSTPVAGTARPARSGATAATAR